MSSIGTLRRVDAERDCASAWRCGISRRILVVDDDIDILSFITTGLKLSGYEVYSAEDGLAGLTMAKDVKPELIVLDLAMPRMHGYEVCEAVRKDKEISATKIIVTSGKTYPVDIKTAMDMGADKYMTKPYGIAQLIQQIDELLGAEKK
ncbi:MAG: response regulator [Elusimicrobia bacterium]|nr:response regulator [Elusimicrobiota bacterium]